MGASFEISMAGEALLPKAWIDRYLERGELSVMYTSKESRPIGVAVVTDENKGICELKNLAIHPAFQCKGFGMKLINKLCEHYKHRFHTMQAPATASKAAGFKKFLCKKPTVSP